MYHCQIAQSEQALEDIARLNYETFVEEIPQHPRNTSGLLVDKFHSQNTYLVMYHEHTLIAMVAFRDQRPFSLDGKIGAVEAHLPQQVCERLCEIRLLAVKKNYRQSFVFLRLAQALYSHVLHQSYSACVISGTTRQKKLYERIGFQAFAPVVGTKDASFIPMVLTMQQAHEFHAPFLQRQKVFYPGPVQQKAPLKHTTLSHRSPSFVHLLAQVKRQLLNLSQAQNVAVFQGSGTLANEMMLQQLKSRHAQELGLICSNGAFGQRLIEQATQLGLNFDTYQCHWTEAFDAPTLMRLSQGKTWLLAVHGETSSGQLNDLSALIACKKQHRLTLALDCISSFGACEFSLQEVDLASATSGKAIGALAGLGCVFYQDTPCDSSNTVYANLAHYHHHVPYTLPAYLLDNVHQALQQYPQRFELLQQRLQQVLHCEALVGDKVAIPQHYPTAITFQWRPEKAHSAMLNGLLLHHHSAYLQQRQWVQISVIQPYFEDDFESLLKWHEYWAQHQHLESLPNV